MGTKRTGTKRWIRFAAGSLASCGKRRSAAVGAEMRAILDGEAGELDPDVDGILETFRRPHVEDSALYAHGKRGTRQREHELDEGSNGKRALHAQAAAAGAD